MRVVMSMTFHTFQGAPVAHSFPRTIHVVLTWQPRRRREAVSAEYQRGGCGVAATCLTADYPRGGRGVAATGPRTGNYVDGI